MKIQSIKWNGQVMDVTHIGEKTGTKFVYESAELTHPNLMGNNTRKCINKIEEITTTVYDIHYRYDSKNHIQRIFNPIEVNFIEE